MVLMWVFVEYPFSIQTQTYSIEWSCRFHCKQICYFWRTRLDLLWGSEEKKCENLSMYLILSWRKIGHCTCWSIGNPGCSHNWDKKFVLKLSISHWRFRTLPRGWSINIWISDALNAATNWTSVYFKPLTKTSDDISWKSSSTPISLRIGIRL